MIYRINILEEEIKRDLPQFASKQSVELHKRRDAIRKRVRREWIARQNAEVATDRAYDAGFDPNEARDPHGRWTKGGGEIDINDWEENPLNEQSLPRYTIEEVRETIENDFPNMHNYQVVGAPDHDYNCIAWAFGFEDKWWNPGVYSTVEVDKALEEYHANIFYHSGAREMINKPPKEHRVKIALFEDDGQFCHMCRQLPDGRWTSKFGGNGKTVQNNLAEMEGGMYGEITRVYDMPIKEFSRFRKEHRFNTDSSGWL